MRVRFWLACGFLTACGASAGTAGAPPADAAAETSDAATVDSAVDAATDSGGPSTSVFDGGPDKAAPIADSPAVKMCQDIVSQICKAAKSCCAAGVSMDCEANETADCLKLGFGGIDEASAAGVVKLDAGRGADCKAALTAAAKACDYVALKAAERRCLMAWLDSASKGDKCTATAPVACDSFAGRCNPVTTDTYTCSQAGAAGDACKPTQLCGVDLECLNGNLTRDMKCGKPGATCHLSDACAQGFQCVADACQPWTGGAKDGGACKTDPDCAVGLTCSGGKCGPSMCGL